ncbi:MerR family transcriptional regulator [Thermopolyspora flexuosa]|uniref:DNA-binding transcriptional MerR regulator n=1 Tax=Thermopolyspora flexuosa TaxID=103836 RepID=A0A543IU97_9ACTN|nr:MerR family transcriptional regulator [Thermopolyspora flexuosa]TQM74150.1 DNA-binding transcriptional MerR regulator [Thermopolyspora flexuosa]
MSTCMTIAEVAKRTGLTPHTLRYYEREGLLLREVDRSSTGRRLYHEDDITWIRLITRLRATGMPIREVRRYAELARAGDATRRERLELLRAHRRRVIERLTVIEEHLKAIDYKIEFYEECCRPLGRLTSSAL